MLLYAGLVHNGGGAIALIDTLYMFEGNPGN